MAQTRIALEKSITFSARAMTTIVARLMAHASPEEATGLRARRALSDEGVGFHSIENLYAYVRLVFMSLELRACTLAMVVALVESCADYMDVFNARYIIGASAILTFALIDDSGDSTAMYRRYLYPEVRLEHEQLARAERFVFGAALRCIDTFGFLTVPSRHPRSPLASYARYNHELKPFISSLAYRDLATAWRRAVAEAALRRAERERKAAAAISLQRAFRARLASLGGASLGGMLE